MKTFESDQSSNLIGIFSIFCKRDFEYGLSETSNIVSSTDPTSSLAERQPSTSVTSRESGPSAQNLPDGISYDFRV